MKKRIFGWISVLIGIVLSLAAIEVAAIALLYVEDGRYTPAADLFERTQNTYVRDATKGTSCRYVDTLYPHPYVAFVHHANPPCGIPYLNAQGLYGPDFPAVRDPNFYTIMLVGGSVASQLAQNGPPNWPRYFEQELNRRFVSPNGKPWRVLNGGDGAWKEPQPFILFTLYASAIDAVVNLSGFNEHYFFQPWMRERLERPASNFLDVNPFVADENFGDAAIGWVLGRVAGVLAQNPVLGNSHAAYLIVRGIEAVAKGQDSFKSNKRTTINGMFALPESVWKDPNTLFNFQLGLYQKYLRATEAVARVNGLKSAYFIQPAPAIGKALTEDERRVVGDLSYGPIYERIVAGVLTLKDRGMAVYDLGDLFAAESITIYEDHIHFLRDRHTGESRGYRLMAARMADRLAETWGLQARR